MRISGIDAEREWFLGCIFYSDLMSEDGRSQEKRRYVTGHVASNIDGAK